MNATATLEGHGWLRGPGFDLTFIVGIAAVALAAGAAVSINSAWFWPLLVADLWLLGYHHVVATYTRLAFDSASFRQHRKLVLYLPPVVALAVLALVLSAGLWVVATIYLYWQWYHYTRQSEGISKAYGGKSRDRQLGDLRIGRLAFYMVPAAGILAASARDPDKFLGMPVATLPVPDGLVLPILALAATAFAAWVWEQFKAWRAGQLALPYVLYVTSHFVIYSTAYIWLENLDHGWLVINIWHNAQYIGFVWLFNNRRFGGKVSAEHPFISTISQNRRFLLYTAVCLTISTAIYYLLGAFAVDGLKDVLHISAPAAALIIYQTINFHHYVVDATIWKLRKKPIRANLGLA